MTLRKQKLRLDGADMLAGAVVIAVFGFFFFFFDVRLLSDSHQHLTQSIAREPVYALFLKYSKYLFGESYFLVAVGFLQNALAAASIFYVQKELGKLFSLTKVWRVGMVFLLLAPHLVTPLASNTHFILTNAILTEGITFSLYYIWITWIANGLLGEQNRKAYVRMSFFGALFLSLIRGSMMVCFLVWGIVMVYLSLREKKYRYFILCVAAVAVAFCARTVLVRTYNYTQQGFFTDTTSGAPMMLANVLYVAEPKDGPRIKDPTIQALFDEIMEKLEADGKTSKSASGSWLDDAKFHESVHDEINFEYIAPIIRAEIEQTKGIDGSRFTECMMELDKVSGNMTKELLPAVAGKFLKNYFVIASLGFIRSIGVEQSMIWMVTLIAYLLGISLSGYLLCKDKNSKSAQFMLLVLLLICGNVFATSLMIQCISRYMIYNLPFFYLAIGIMLLELWNQKKRRQ